MSSLLIVEDEETLAKNTVLYMERYGWSARLAPSAEDALASQSVGAYINAHMPGSQMHVLDAAGHCLQMTHPVEVARLIREFLATLP